METDKYLLHGYGNISVHMIISKEQVGYVNTYCREGTEVYLVFFEGLLLNVSVSEKVELTIVEQIQLSKGTI